MQPASVLMKKCNDDIKLCILSCMLAMVSETITILSAMFMGDAIDLATTGELHSLLRLCCVLLGMTLINNMIFIGSVNFNLQFANHVTAKLRNSLAHSFLRREISQFTRQDHAYYANLMSGDTDKLCDSYFSVISVEVKFLVLFIGSVVAMASIHIALFLVAILFAFVPMLVTWLFEKRIQKEVINCSQKSELFQGAYLQIIQGYETLKLNSNSIGDALKSFQSANTNDVKAKIQTELLQSISYLTIDLLNTLGQLVLLGVGGCLIVANQITAGELLSCTVLSGYVCNGVNNFLEQHMHRKSMIPVLEKVIGEIQESEQKKMPVVIPDFSKGIEYKKVSFRFADYQELYSNLSLTFEPAKCYAIVGESGRGKSTLVKLMLRYYPDYSGEISVFGHSIKDYDSDQLFCLVGMLNQTEFILNTSLYDNITLFGGSPEQESSSYQNILKVTNLTKLADRVQDKPLGDFGDLLSGGERQRIALARVLLRKPKVIIFDEPTSGLDPENRDIINQVIFSLSDTIRIIITHDQSEEYLSQFDAVIHL